MKDKRQLGELSCHRGETAPTFRQVSEAILCLIAEGQQNMPSPLWHIDYFELQALEKCRNRLSMNSPYQSKDMCSKKSSIVINSLPGNFTNQRRLLLITGEETTPHPEKLCHKLSYLAFILPRAHSSFLKIIYSSLYGLHVPLFSLLRQYLSLNSKPPVNYSFFPW